MNGSWKVFFSARSLASPTVSPAFLWYPSPGVYADFRKPFGDLKFEALHSNGRPAAQKFDVILFSRFI